MKMLKENIENFDRYAGFLANDTLEGLANLILEGRKPGQALLENLVLRDTHQITNEQFFTKELARIKGVFPSADHAMSYGTS